MKSREEIINEAVKCRKIAEEASENGYYMKWQQYLTREQALLWCIDDEKGGVENDE